jgi:hypothetical protein
VGDDVLFDQLETLADQDADADARGVVIARLQELGNDPNVAEVLAALDLDVDAPADPAPAVTGYITVAHGSSSSDKAFGLKV